jgi:hypothetical protein
MTISTIPSSTRATDHATRAIRGAATGSTASASMVIA